MEPNITPFPTFAPLPETWKGKVVLKLADNITTDHIMPAGAKILPLRSNIPAISEYVFSQITDSFARDMQATAAEGFAGAVIGGDNYGQGSSREHAALAPRYLGRGGKAGQELRPHSQGQPDQLRHRAAHLR